MVKICLSQNDNVLIIKGLWESQRPHHNYLTQKKDTGVFQLMNDKSKNIDSKPESTTLKSLTHCKTFSFYSNLHHYQHINTKKGMLSTSHWPQDKYVPVINITNGWLIVHKPLTFLIISTYEHHMLKSGQLCAYLLIWQTLPAIFATSSMSWWNINYDRRGSVASSIMALVQLYSTSKSVYMKHHSNGVCPKYLFGVWQQPVVVSEPRVTYNVCMCKGKQTHTHSLSLFLTHTRTCIYIDDSHTHKHTHTLTHIYTHTYSHIYKYTQLARALLSC